jgi:hypothetical protein
MILAMGTFGLSVIARHTGQLTELACIADLNLEPSQHAYADAWISGFIFSSTYIEPEPMARALVAATNAPAIAMFIQDSDFADAFCASPGGVEYAFFLDEETFRKMLTDEFDQEDVAEELAAGPRNPGAIPALMQWAAEAGLVPDKAQLELALAERPGPFSEGVDAFEEAIGLRM